MWPRSGHAPRAQALRAAGRWGACLRLRADDARAGDSILPLSYIVWALSALWARPRGVCVVVFFFARAGTPIPARPCAFIALRPPTCRTMG